MDVQVDVYCAHGILIRKFEALFSRNRWLRYHIAFNGAAGERYAKDIGSP
jgi:hypothetical protein